MIRPTLLGRRRRAILSKLFRSTWRWDTDPEYESQWPYSQQQQQQQKNNNNNKQLQLTERTQRFYFITHPRRPTRGCWRQNTACRKSLENGRVTY